jgi:hypothetical protein
MEIVTICAVVALVLLLLLAGVHAVREKAPPLRLIAVLGMLLLAVLALGTGNPEIVEKIIGAIGDLFK